MLIAIDGFEASADSRVGVGRWEVELLKHLAGIDHKNSYRIYTPRPPQRDLPPETKHWRYRVCSFSRLWSQVALPYYLLKDRPRPDVFFAPVHYAPRFCPVPTVVGIMDLSFIHFPDLFRRSDWYKLQNWTSYSIRKARAVIAISKATKRDILKTYQVTPDAVTVIYPGVETGFKPVSTGNMNRIHTKYGIRGDYILYVGTLQPRKNLVRLIDAFKQIIHSQKSATNLQLVIVGKKGWLYDEIFRKVKKEGLESNIIFTGFVPDEDLPSFYAGAKCFCLVSLYEGFGFPVLEAMHAGTPVVASNVSSLPELVGDAGVLVDPGSVEDITRGIREVLTMPASQREQLIEKGKKQAGKFTWEKAARETLSVLEKVAKDSTNYE
ncbi:MAG TPA: glycosyltransferase family 1 protein [Patescibacteria group bacterium]|nr:glycosyltransferase family 1 protein [Patescibacteria group bacterium]